MKFSFPHHDPKSHKGQVGKILIIGGSNQYYGAPILTALGAENSGADLITLCLPAQYAANARNYSLNFFIHELYRNYLSLSDLDIVANLLLKQDSAVIGNGLGNKAATKEALVALLSIIKIPIVLDAEALIPEILDINHQNEWIITPHKKEFERMFNLTATETNIRKQAQKYNLTIIVKGAIDIIIDSLGQTYHNTTGCSIMRVGGTGDVLAGIIGSLVAQKAPPFQACCTAAYYWGLVGETLSKKRKFITAKYMAEQFPCIACNNL